MARRPVDLVQELRERVQTQPRMGEALDIPTDINGEGLLAKDGNQGYAGDQFGKILHSKEEIERRFLQDDPLDQAPRYQTVLKEGTLSVEMNDLVPYERVHLQPLDKEKSRKLYNSDLEISDVEVEAYSQGDDGGGKSQVEDCRIDTHPLSPNHNLTHSEEAPFLGSLISIKEK